MHLEKIIKSRTEHYIPFAICHLTPDLLSLCPSRIPLRTARADMLGSSADMLGGSDGRAGRLIWAAGGRLGGPGRRLFRGAAATIDRADLCGAPSDVAVPLSRRASRVGARCAARPVLYEDTATTRARPALQCGARAVSSRESSGVQQCPAVSDGVFCDVCCCVVSFGVAWCGGVDRWPAGWPDPWPGVREPLWTSWAVGGDGSHWPAHRWGPSPTALALHSLCRHWTIGSRQSDSLSFDHQPLPGHWVISVVFARTLTRITKNISCSSISARLEKGARINLPLDENARSASAKN